VGYPKFSRFLLLCLYSALASAIALAESPTPAPALYPLYYYTSAALRTPTPTSHRNASTPHTPVPTPYVVKLRGFNFIPRRVVIKRNQSIRWIHRQSGVTHDIDSDDGVTFASPDMQKGDVYKFKFVKRGKYPYHCNFHGAAGGQGMAGTVVVK